MLKKIIIKVCKISRVMHFILANNKVFFRKKCTIHLNTLNIFQKTYLYPKGGKYVIGRNVQFGYNIGGRYRKGYCELQSRTTNSKIKIGDNTAINNNLLIISCKSVEIGKNCRIGANCQIMDFDGHGVDPLRRSEVGKISKIEISDNVWIGNNSIILCGSKIGKNSIVAAGAVVKGKFPDNVVIGGIPAKIIKSI